MMKGLSRKLYQIVAALIVSVSIIGLVNFAFPGYADTYDDLKDIFVTRDEVNNWKKNFRASGSEIIDLETYLKNLEINMQREVQAKVKVEMAKRNIKDDNDKKTTS